MMNYEKTIALTMWLMEDRGVINGTKEDRIEAFREYLDLAGIDSKFYPIPRKFSEEILKYKWEGLMYLSDIENECIRYNAGRMGYARDLSEVFEEMEMSEGTFEEEAPIRLVANPKSKPKPTEPTKRK